MLSGFWSQKQMQRQGWRCRLEIMGKCGTWDEIRKVRKKKRTENKW